MKQDKIKQVNVHYIVGMGRSGTTLLSAMLNSSDRVLSIPEIPLTMHFFESKYKKSIFTSADVNDLLFFKGKMKFARKLFFFLNG